MLIVHSFFTFITLNVWEVTQDVALNSNIKTLCLSSIASNVKISYKKNLSLMI